MWWSGQRRWVISHLGGQTKVAEVAVYSLKTLKKHKENKGRKVEGQGQIRNGKRRELPPSL
jgi:hypothetical protein